MSRDWVAEVRRRLGAAALLPPAALAVHQLRYFLAYGRGASAELQHTGHSYLHSVVPWLVVLVALAIGSFLRSLGRTLGGRQSASRRAASFTGLWLACATCLVCIFACQELLEGLFASGHPTGIAGIFGYGGWWSIPAAVCVGLVLAACLYGAHWVLAEVARRCTAPQPGWPAPRLAVTGARAAAVIPASPLVAGWSDRGPPR
jgi:hypothetical protein